MYAEVQQINENLIVIDHWDDRNKDMVEKCLVEIGIHGRETLAIGIKIDGSRRVLRLWAFEKPKKKINHKLSTVNIYGRNIRPN